MDIAYKEVLSWALHVVQTGDKSACLSADSQTGCATQILQTELRSLSKPLRLILQERYINICYAVISVYTK